MKIPLAPTLLWLSFFAALCLLAGCDHTSPLKARDTATLGHRIQSATEGVHEAKRSTAAISGNVAKARLGSDRIDAKSSVVRRWLEAQP